MSWWPSAGGAAWDWGWTPYPAVWLLLIAIGGAYARLGALAAPGAPPHGRPRGQPGPDRAVRRRAGGAPGPPSTGRSARSPPATWRARNALQDLLITLGAAPLLLLGLPRGRPRLEQAPRGLRDHATQRARRALGSPLVGGATFAIALAVTHLPAVVDTLRPSPWGSFAITARPGSPPRSRSGRRWSGPLAGRHRPPYLVGMLYLVAPFIFPKVVGAFYLFRDDPLYDVYEGAPRVWSRRLRARRPAGGRPAALDHRQLHGDRRARRAVLPLVPGGPADEHARQP